MQKTLDRSQQLDSSCVLKQSMLCLQAGGLADRKVASGLASPPLPPLPPGAGASVGASVGGSGLVAFQVSGPKYPPKEVGALNNLCRVLGYSRL